MSTEMNKISPQYIGAMCGQYRRYYTVYTQADVAEQLGVDRTVISKFERGKNNNAIIFMWYIKHGIFDWVPVEGWDGWF